MTDMEHAIEQAALAEANRRHAAAERSLNKSKYGEGSDYHANDGARDGFVDGAEWAFEHLRAAGLLAPAPLRGEWGVRWDDHDTWGDMYNTRHEAEAGAGDEGTPVHRYVTDWGPLHEPTPTERGPEWTTGNP